MNAVFVLMLTVGLLVTTLTQGGDTALSALMNGAGEAVTLCISLMGAYLFWMGMLNVAKRAGLIDRLSKLLSPVIRFLFPKAGKAAGPIAMNLAANMLGMGNAATPYGLEAMRLLSEQAGRPTSATNEMCVLLAVNASCLELLPTGVLALRQAAGSLSPASILLPTLLSSACATLVAVLLCRLLCRRERGKRDA